MFFQKHEYVVFANPEQIFMRENELTHTEEYAFRHTIKVFQIESDTRNPHWGDESIILKIWELVHYRNDQSSSSDVFDKVVILKLFSIFHIFPLSWVHMMRHFHVRHELKYVQTCYLSFMSILRQNVRSEIEEEWKNSI